MSKVANTATLAMIEAARKGRSLSGMLTPDVDVNYKDEHGKAALHYTTSGNTVNGANTDMLACAGANPFTPDNEGKTPFKNAVEGLFIAAQHRAFHEVQYGGNLDLSQQDRNKVGTLRRNSGEYAVDALNAASNLKAMMDGWNEYLKGHSQGTQEAAVMSGERGSWKDAVGTQMVGAESTQLVGTQIVGAEPARLPSGTLGVEHITAVPKEERSH